MIVRTVDVGSFQRTVNFLQFMKTGIIFNVLDKYGREGVALLSNATPKETGETANAWSYQVSRQNGRYVLSWFNNHEEDGVNIAIILQYGHATGTGGYVTGIDYINPALRPLFDKILEDIWRQVRNA